MKKTKQLAYSKKKSINLKIKSNHNFKKVFPNLQLVTNRVNKNNQQFMRLRFNHFNNSLNNLKEHIKK